MEMRVTGTNPANEDRAVSLHTRTPITAESAMTSHTAYTGVCVRGWICFHQRDPGRPLSLARANVTLDASTPCVTPFTHCTNKNGVEGSQNQLSLEQRETRGGPGQRYTNSKLPTSLSSRVCPDIPDPLVYSSLS